MTGENDQTTDNNNSGGGEEAPDPFEGFESGEFVDGVEITDDKSGDQKKEGDDGSDDGTDDGSDDGTSGDDGESSGGDSDDGSDDSDDGADGESDGDDDKGDKKPPKKSFKQRINELTREKHDAKREAEAERERNRQLEARLTKLESGADKKDGDDGDDDNKVTDSPPNPKDYEYGELDSKYVNDLTEYKATQKVSELRAELEKERQTEAAERITQELSQKRDVIIERGHAEYEDFQEKVVEAAEKGSYPLSPEMAQLILDSDVGEHVAYHIASDVNEATRISELSPAAQGAEFARLEARYSKESSDGDSAKPEQSQKTVTPSKAPNPPKNQARGSGGKFGASPDTEDFAAFEKGFTEGSLR